MFRYIIELIYPLDNPSPDGSEKGFLVVGRQQHDPTFQVGDEFWLCWGANNKFLVKVVEYIDDFYLSTSTNDSPGFEMGQLQTRILVEAMDKEALMELLAYNKTLSRL
jgi:hypothetical protein